MNKNGAFMLVKFIGATERVTGSCTWLKNGEIEFLVDCGMIQGESHSDYDNKKKFIFDPKKIKFVLLTHAHIDHCGLIPRLYKEGFVGKVICTKATSLLANEILLDAVKFTPPYDIDDVTLVKYLCIDERPDFKWNSPIPIDNDLFITATRSAHILGAISIGILWNKEKRKSILFTGDIGNNTEDNPYQPLLKYRQSPFQRFEYIVCESTYGQQNRNISECSLDHRIEQLEKVIIETIYIKGGNLIIPTFSLHRTQEILFDLFYLLKVKWNGKLPQKKYEITLSAFLKNKGIYDNNLIRFKNYNALLSNPNVPLKMKNKIKSCFFPVFKFSKIEFENLESANFYTMEIKNLLKTEGKNYFLYSYELSDLDSISKIENHFKENNKENNILYKFEETKFDEPLEEDLNQLLEVEKIPIKIVCDSALGKRISNIYGDELLKIIGNGNEYKRMYLNPKIMEWFNCDEKIMIETLKNLFTQDHIELGEHSISWSNPKQNSIPQKEPKIIITSSGMCDAGPVLSHLENNLNWKLSTIALTGYQSGGTNGSRLSKLEKLSQEEKQNSYINLESGKLPCSEVKAQVVVLTGYSGHADQNSLLNYLFTDTESFKYTIPNIFLNHGDNNTRETFKEKILERSDELGKKYEGKLPFKTKVIIPKKDSGWYDLDKEEWIKEEQGEQNFVSNQDIVNALNNLTKAIENLTLEIKNKFNE